MKATWCLVLLVVGCGKGPAATMAMPDLGGATSMDAGDPLDEYVLAHMKTAMVPGLAAAVVKNDQVVLARAWGTADLTDGRPATVDTLFMLASVSKTVTAVALMQLVEQGKLTLDEPVDAKLGFQVRNPAFPNTPLTARMLLSHTSSIEDGPRFYSYNVVGIDSPIALDAFVQGYLTGGGTYFDAANWNATAAPGTHYSYSNAGIALAGDLIEKVAGMSLQQYCQQYLFGPLGMSESSFRLGDLDRAHIAMPYDSDGNGGYTEEGYFCYPDYPAGGLRTSANQLARFLMAFIQFGQLGAVQILTRASVEEMRKQQPSSEEGLSWEFAPLGARQLIGHSGGDAGVSTDMYFDPTTGAGFVVLTNSLVWADLSRADALGEIEEKLLDLAP